MPEQRFLGFDFGLRYIGVAAGQSLTCSAQAVTTLAAKKGNPDWQEVMKLIQTWQPDALVVGIPLNMDGTEQPLTHAARKFANALHQHSKLPVYPMDERLTSVEARSRLFAKGGFRSLQKKAIDSLAAQLILENWLQENSKCTF